MSSSCDSCLWRPHNPCITVTPSLYRRRHAPDTPVDAAKADVWALGVTMATCLFGFFPWAAAHSSDPAFALWCTGWSKALTAGALAAAPPGPAGEPIPAISQLRLPADGVSDHRGAVDCTMQSPESEHAAAALGHLLLRCCAWKRKPVPCTLLDLLVRMLDPRPTTRLTMAQVAAHEWFVCGKAGPRLVAGLTDSDQGANPSTL
jgi:serine/threonine protein kinase